VGNITKDVIITETLGKPAWRWEDIIKKGSKRMFHGI
jgi:hypothetical protein